jgi:hypothetical protein
VRPRAAHGTRARYLSRVDPCRCELCRAANAAYIKAYRERDRDLYLRKRRIYRAVTTKRKRETNAVQ